MSAVESLRVRLQDPRLLLVPGAPNALTARIIEDAGFEAAYVTGAGVSNTFLGVPDIGLLTVSQLIDHVSAMSDATRLPLIVDADTGFGNAINTAQTVRALERAGASAVQLEDQTFPKRCGHFAGKDVVSASEMVQKIHAAVDARASEETLVVARTDARAALGLDAACERAELYRDAGADVLFVEAPQSEDEISTIASRVGGAKLLNIVRGGATPEPSAERIQELGFQIALHANLPLLGMIAGVQGALRRLLINGSSVGDTKVASWSERQRLVGLAEFQRLEQQYAVEER